MSRGPRRIMAHELSMPALKISNPIEEFILMKIDNLARGSDHFCLHGFHIGAEPILHPQRCLHCNSTSFYSLPEVQNNRVAPPVLSPPGPT